MERSADRSHKLRTHPAQQGPLGASPSDPISLQSTALATRYSSGADNYSVAIGVQFNCELSDGWAVAACLVASARPM